MKLQKIPCVLSFLHFKNVIHVLLYSVELLPMELQESSCIFPILHIKHVILLYSAELLPMELHETLCVLPFLHVCFTNVILLCSVELPLMKL